VYQQLIEIKEEEEGLCNNYDDMASSLKDNDIQMQLNTMLIPFISIRNRSQEISKILKIQYCKKYIRRTFEQSS